MITLILPGYSEHNKIWAEEVAESLSNDGLPTRVHYWRHWSNGGSLSLKYEVNKIIEEIKKEKVNIVAKSVGVYVALKLIPKISSQVHKVVLCGIASVANAERTDLLTEALKLVPVENVLCIQNENDKYVKFTDARHFYHSVEPKLEVISKPRSDHDYPFIADFRNYLKD